MTPEERAALCSTCGLGVTLPHRPWCERVRLANQAEIERAYPAYRTHCPHGHEWNEENTYQHPSSGRQCRACHRGNRKQRSDRGRLAAA